MRDDIGDLVTRRPLPGPGLEQLDPFLFLNHHGPQTYRPGNRGLPFGPHPHRGFETVTFILDGVLAHRDTGGHESVIAAGGVQWMTAGSGLVHAEISPDDFKARGGALEILQLWVNLPARLKFTAPRYVGVQRDDIPVIAAGGATVALIAGAWRGQVGPIESLTGVFMTTLQMPAGSALELDAPRARSLFLYVAGGAVRVAGEPAERFTLVELNHDGDRVAIEATHDAVLLFGHGDVIGEPMVAYGPFVMNTEQEIRDAITDYQAGRFGAMT